LEAAPGGYLVPELEHTQARAAGEQCVEVFVDDDAVQEAQCLESGELASGGGRRAKDERSDSSTMETARRKHGRWRSAGFGLEQCYPSM
jgi:hypothetical protein